MNAERTIIAPVVSIPVECSIDRMIARDTARRVAGALGFSPVQQAQIGLVIISLVDLLLKTNSIHELSYHGIRCGEQIGLQVACDVCWLSDAPRERVAQGLQMLLGGLTDEIQFEQGNPSVIRLAFWQHTNATRA